MKLIEYQESLRNFDNYPQDLGPFYIILGVQQATGKLSEKIKNLLSDEEIQITDKDKINISLAIGDIFFNCSSLATSLNISLEQIAALSLRKLSMLKEQELKAKLNKKEDK